MEQRAGLQNRAEQIRAALAWLLASGVGLLVAAGLLGGGGPRFSALFLGAIVAGIVLAHPFTGLVALLGLNLLRPEDTFPAIEGTRLTFLAAVAVFAGWAGATFVGRRPLARFAGVPLMTAFVAAGVLATAVRVEGPPLVEAATHLLRLWLFYFLAVQIVQGERRSRLIAGFLLFFTVALAAWSIYNAFTGQHALIDDDWVRAQGTGVFDDPNDLALILLMAVPLALAGLLDGREAPLRLLCLAGLAVLIYAVIMTDSRGGILGLGVVLVAMLGRRVGVRGLLVGAVLVAALAFAFQPERVTQLEVRGDESAQGRLEAWRAGLDMLRGSPLLGVGVLQFGEQHWRAAHNTFVQVMAETGWLGMFLWLALFYYTLCAALAARRACEKRKEGARLVPLLNGMEAALIGFAVGGFLLSRAYLPALYLYLGIWAAIARAGLSVGNAPAPPLDHHFCRRVALLCVGGVLFTYLLIWKFH